MVQEGCGAAMCVSGSKAMARLDRTFPGSTVGAKSKSAIATR